MNIDYENEDLNKFSPSQMKAYLNSVDKFKSYKGKQKMVDWCMNQCMYDELARIAMIDYEINNNTWWA